MNGKNKENRRKHMLIEFVKLIGLTLIIVLIAKYILVTLLRRLAETLHLGPKAVGNIAGATTSVPELLTVSFSALGGFLGTSLFNIVSSNIINVLQYVVAIILHKNTTYLKNKAIKIDLFIVAITILTPVLMIIWNKEMHIGVVPILLILFVIGYFINYNAHKLYVNNAMEEEKNETKNHNASGKHIAIYSILLIVTGTVLFIVGEGLHVVLENLTLHFQIPEFILGILLGVVTSIPELITFFESQRHHQKNSQHGVIEATNNLLTSNLLNLCIIQSIGIMIYAMVK